MPRGESGRQRCVFPRQAHSPGFLWSIGAVSTILLHSIHPRDVTVYRPVIRQRQAGHDLEAVRLALTERLQIAAIRCQIKDDLVLDGLIKQDDLEGQCAELTNQCHFPAVGFLLEEWCAARGRVGKWSVVVGDLIEAGRSESGAGCGADGPSGRSISL